MLLIHPPISKPSEPPPGIAALAGALRSRGIRCALLDASLEGILHLLEHSGELPDRWSKRAFRNREKNLDFLRSKQGYLNFDRYKRACADLNRLLDARADNGPWRLSLSNLQHAELSPVRSADLLKSALNFEENPFYPYFSRRLERIIESERHTAVGFSLNYLSQALCAFAMAGFIKKRYPGLKIVFGGGLITSWLRKPGRRNPFSGLIDKLVAGPGENELLAMLGAEPIRPGTSAPDYDGLPLDDYAAPGRILPYSASSGCYWNRCSFCPEKAEGNPYIPVPTRRAMDELEKLAARMRPILIHILDNAVSPALMRALTERPPIAPWYGFARITRRLADPDFCLALKRSGCVMLKLGLESGDQSVIDRERKGIDLNTASQALRSLKNAGIATYVYLLFGTPSETEAEARRTMEFTVRHSAEIDFLNPAIFNLPLHSPDAAGLDVEPLSEGDLSLYTGFRHPGGWDRASIRRFLDREFKRQPSVARILRSDPPFFTSNHAPFFGSSQRYRP